MTNIRRIFTAAFVFVLTSLLSGCQLALLNPKGIIAAQEKYIMMTSAILMLMIVIPVIMLTLMFAYRYRESNTNATYAPEFSHSTLLEVIWWSIPCIIIAILGTITWISSHRLDPYRPLAINEKPLVIEAIALRWKWLFIYPEQDIASVNFVEFPVNTPVEFLISSEGPMNSLQIPQLAGQIYAMAGMQTKLHLLANELGDYSGMSANFSGTGFAGMNFIARVSTKNQFEQWVHGAKKSQDNLDLVAYNKLIEPSEYNSVQYFASTNKDLFNMVVMKSMMPMNMTPKTEMAKSNQHPLIAASK